VTQTALLTAINAAKEKLPKQKISDQVSSTVYNAATAIAENVAYVRTAYDTAHWLTEKLPNVERRAYNAAINAAKVTHDLEYNDPQVQARIAAAIMQEMIAGARRPDPTSSVIAAISRPKDPYCATQVLAREAAQRVFKSEDDVTRAVVS